MGFYLNSELYTCTSGQYLSTEFFGSHNPNVLNISHPVYEQYAGPLVIDRQLVNKTSNFSKICDLLVIYIIQIYYKL